MRVPRDVNADNLIKILLYYDYHVVRQTGSHIRLLKKTENKCHIITIPNHKPIKIGTLHGIIKEVCQFNEIKAECIYEQL